ncbi:hypothetical protein Gogos_005530 [Gossypium gossypioides]|uniref:DUF4283 domain-containing protein n=1 Tax=Gossypium gossypioides TaxID=34282 RepID=A0A7J9CY61_GOSGO|nr:hypothetical protein [Gossypium gossypioides]
MEDSIAVLSLDDEEEEIIQLEVEETSQEILYVNCLVGVFLTSSVMGDDPLTVQLHGVDFWLLIHDLPLGFMVDTVAHQLGNFIGEFIEYDTSATQLGYKCIMRIRVRVDVKKPLKRKKKIVMKNEEQMVGGRRWKETYYSLRHDVNEGKKECGDFEIKSSGQRRELGFYPKRFYFCKR